MHNTVPTAFIIHHTSSYFFAHRDYNSNNMTTTTLMTMRSSITGVISLFFAILPLQISSLTIDPTVSKQQKHHHRVVIVGGGVGGLATACRIASAYDNDNGQQTCQVTLVEKNAMMGGRCGSFDVTIPTKGTFRHERGPSLLLLKQIYQDLFLDCASCDSEKYGLEMKQCVPAYQVVFDDGDCIELGFPKHNNDEPQQQQQQQQQAHRTAEQISRTKMDEYEPHGSTKWDEYMSATSAFLDCGLPNFIEERFDIKSFPAFLYEALRESGKAWPLKPHSDVLDLTFESNKMRALASFQDLYVGLEPYKNEKGLFGGVLRKTAPAVFGLLAAIELHPTNDKAGVFAPIGGFRAVEQAFQRLATEKGVDIRLGKTVTNVQSDGIHFCDTTAETNNDDDDASSSSDFLPTDLVIVNADLPFATETLLNAGANAQPKYDWDDKYDFSSGVIAFHWCLDKSLDDLNTHNVFLEAGNRDRAEQSWTAVRSPNSDHGDDSTVEPFNFYLHRATKTDPTAAPDGCDSIMVLVPCNTLRRNQEYAKLSRSEAIEKYKDQFHDKTIAKAREAVYQRLAAIDSLRDVQKHIIDEVVDTPATYGDLYNLGAGTPFALSHGFGQLSLTRPPAESKIPNVFFVGASSRPGNGVPLVLLGAKLVAEKSKRFLTKLVDQTTK